MTNLEAITLGVVQGLTEFLPISSTAHLRIVPALLGWEDPGAAYSAVIQCGTLAAVVLAMRHDIASLASGLVRGVASGRPLSLPESRTALLIVVGTLPIVAVGFAARHLIRGEARRLEVVTAALLFTTFLMAAAEWLSWRRARRGITGRDGLAGVTLTDGLAMGLAQVLALVPGTSRSGVTISCGMATGLDRRTAARFSFLLSLPAVGAAGLLEAWQQREAIFGSPEAVTTAALGTLSAAIVGYLAIRWLLRILTSHTLWPFIAYRLALAALLAWSLTADVSLRVDSPNPASGSPYPASRRMPPSARKPAAQARFIRPPLQPAPPPPAPQENAPTPLACAAGFRRSRNDDARSERPATGHGEPEAGPRKWTAPRTPCATWARAPRDPCRAV